VINTIEANTRTENLLKQSQSLAEELQSRQQELQNTNLELQEKAQLLAHQNEEVERKNREVEQARQALEEKAEQLALTSKYKSEFLANMSHELRTPLNSLLILSDQLCKNSDGNLTGKQVEFSKTIHSSGNDLLMLINDILDLSKIESGTVQVDVSEVRLDDVQRSVDRGFRHFAESKHVEFVIQVEQPVPKTIVTDAKRLQQIIKNLLSNAFKFTHKGEVRFSIWTAQVGWSADHQELNRAGQVVAFSVSDTGIGISPDKQQIIFEAFQQADGSTSRKYGGTGLGLAISRELSRLLGGEIKLVSSPGRGSTFTLFLPQSHHPMRLSRPRLPTIESVTDVDANPVLKGPSDGARDAVLALKPQADDVRAGDLSADNDPDSVAFINVAADDRDDIDPGDLVILIVENDLAFAKLMLEAAHEQGFKGVVCTTGASALAMTRECNPCVITLDIFLPDMQGWRILDRLKADLETRHIPICVVSTDDAKDQALRSGALDFLPKPMRSKDEVDAKLAQLRAYVQRKERKVLMLMRPSPMRDACQAVLRDSVEVCLLEDADAAREALNGAFDCLIVDASFEDFGPQDVREAAEGAEASGSNPSIGSTKPLPVIVTGRHDGQRAAWRGQQGFGVREADSLAGLMYELAFCLHRSVADMNEAERRCVLEAYASNGSLRGKKALIVDDDIRNIFALTTVLDDEGMIIVSADNGRDAIRLTQTDPEIDIVLMDIMMPEMDGLATMQEIRKQGRGQDLPMIAVTAKAMKGDRQKCIEAGAWDYLSKPVDPRQLLAVLRGWLCK
jgi:signal transduction histidine kinase/DNA-binding response OmpR family regulator